jgi:hypothetical protein
MIINPKTGTLFERLIEFTDISMVSHPGRMPLTMQQQGIDPYDHHKIQYTNTDKIPDYGAL